MHRLLAATRWDWTCHIYLGGSSGMKKLLAAAGLTAFAGFAMAPAAWAEGNMRKVGIVTFFSVDVASRSSALMRVMDTIRASVPGQNVTFELRSAEGKNDRYPQIVTDLVQQHVDVIYAPPGPAAVAAQQFTTTVPVVFIIAANPVTLGLV